MEAWADPASWLSAQQQLALLLLCSNTLRSEGQFEDGVERVGASLARGAASASAQTPKDNKRSDVFDLAALARQQSDSLSREIATGQETIEHDPDWHVPFLLNEEAALLAVEFKRFLKSGEVWSRTRPERTELERSRMQLFQMVLEHLAEKYEAARQTRTLFRELEAGTRGFVLLLRGFASRAEYRAGISIVRASDLSEKVETVRLAQKVAPIALVWVGNPAESGPLDAVEAQIYRLKDGGEATGFRIEMGSSWERDIRGLISNASFIIVHNPTMTEGVVTEIRLVQELGRRGDTFFYAPEKAAALLGLRAQDCTALDDLAIERMRVTAAGRPLAPGTLPKPTCLWIGGDRRILFEAETSSLRKWINSLTSDALVTLDLRLDANMCLLAHTLLLERLALVPPVLLDLSTIMRSFREEHLEDAEAIADRYAFHAGQLERALMECAPGLSLVEQTAEALQKLLGRKL